MDSIRHGDGIYVNWLTYSSYKVYRGLTVEVLSILQHSGNSQFDFIYKNLKYKDFIWEINISNNYLCIIDKMKRELQFTFIICYKRCSPFQLQSFLECPSTVTVTGFCSDQDAIGDSMEKYQAPSLGGLVHMDPFSQQYLITMSSTFWKNMVFHTR